MSFARLVTPSVNVYAVCPVRSARAVSIATSVSTLYFVLGDKSRPLQLNPLPRVTLVRFEQLINTDFPNFVTVLDIVILTRDAHP